MKTEALQSIASSPAKSDLPPGIVFTGERVVPGTTPENIFRESEMRYVFAGQFVRNRSVIDVASGTGIGTQYLMKAGARSCYGFDMNMESLLYAISAYSDRGCRFGACDAARLAVASSSVDVIVSFETIEHLPDPSVFLRECHRALRRDGFFICSTPDRNFFRWGPANPFHASEMTRVEFLGRVREFFPNCQLYCQGSVNYVRYIAEMIARERIVPILEKLGVKDFLKYLLGPRPGTICNETEFSINDGLGAPYEVKPYNRQWLSRSPYFVVVAQKAAE